MAGLSDVTTALGKLAEAALYPGQVTPSGNSVAGMPVLVQVGWPDPRSLDTMIAAKKAQVTVYPRPVEHNTTRYPRTWTVGAKKPATFTLVQNGQQITVSGSQPNPFYQQNFVVFANGKPYIYSAAPNDTAEAIAAALAQLIAVDIPEVGNPLLATEDDGVIGTEDGLNLVAGLSGDTITLPSAAVIGALRVGTGAFATQEVKRQERQFQLVVWAASIRARDDVSNALDVAIGLTDRLSLADGCRGRLLYKGSPYTDFDQKQGIFRRDFLVSVEYPTINTIYAPEVVAIQGLFYLNSPNLRLATEGGTLIQDGVDSFILMDPDRSAFT
jgi:hypothetical protein